ncbi:sporulation protein [Brevibacillus brevis]|uniref:Sporulation protein n=1 Tax=Brevibacillus brevis TaxID=1393 RepID=A0A2Z4MQP8_BREBE|nr:sporulation protein [Brevibacillus brevis]AWX58681.1 sporulation protein [Brevibacillus brevis]
MRTQPIWLLRSSRVVLGLVVLTTVLTVGCGGNTAKQQGYRTDMRNTQHNMKVRGDQSGNTLQGRTPVAADRDPLMGRNQNPNMVTGRANVRNTPVEVTNMERMAMSVKGVENARITLSDANAYVTLDLVHNITANQARTIEQQVISLLRERIPNYDFHLTSHDGYHR